MDAAVFDARSGQEVVVDLSDVSILTIRKHAKDKGVKVAKRGDKVYIVKESS